MNFDCECQYCGHSWRETFYRQPESVRCPMCNDPTIKFSKVESKDVFGYLKGKQ